MTHHCEETYLATQTTEVGAHTEERCTDQETTVTGHLDEHHGTQTTRVDALSRTTCDNELFDTGAGNHTDGTLTWNIHDGAMITANTFLMTGPQFDMNTRTVRTVTRTVEQKVTVHRNEFMPFKLEMGLAGIKINGSAETSMGIKIDILTGSAYELTGAKTELSAAKIGITVFSFEAYAAQIEVTPMQFCLLGMMLVL